jgi:hypothetical protein
MSLDTVDGGTVLVRIKPVLPKAEIPSTTGTAYTGAKGDEQMFLLVEERACVKILYEKGGRSRSIVPCTPKEFAHPSGPTMGGRVSPFLMVTPFERLLVSWQHFPPGKL